MTEQMEKLGVEKDPAEIKRVHYLTKYMFDQVCQKGQKVLKREGYGQFKLQV